MKMLTRLEVFAVVAVCSSGPFGGPPTICAAVGNPGGACRCCAVGPMDGCVRTLVTRNEPPSGARGWSIGGSLEDCAGVMRIEPPGPLKETSLRLLNLSAVVLLLLGRCTHVCGCGSGPVGGL